MATDLPPDFYLLSREGYDLEEPRKCWLVQRLAYGKRDDLALIQIEPPVMFRDPKEGDMLLDHVVIASRESGNSVFSVDQWPVPVHVARLRRTISISDKKLKDSDIENIAWADIFPSEQDALAKP